MSFERLLKPRTIAVFGGAQAEEVIRQSDRMGYTGEIWPVHPKKTGVLGRTVYRSVGDLPGSPDAAYVGVNRRLTLQIVRDLAARGGAAPSVTPPGFPKWAKRAPNSKRRCWWPPATCRSSDPIATASSTTSTGRCAGPTSRAAGGWKTASPSSPCRPTWASASPCSGGAFPSLI